MVDDAFDRALRRERHLREKLAAGEINDDELEAMQGFERAASNDIRLTVDQARRLVDEGVDPETVAEITSQFPRVSVDEAIEVAVDYGVEVDVIRDLLHAGLAHELDASELTEIFYNEISPDLLRLIVKVGFEPAVAVAVALELSHHLCDPHHTLEALRRAQLAGLTVEQIAAIEDNEINPQVVRRLLDGDPSLGVDGAIRLLLNEDEPEHSQHGQRSIGLVLDEAAVERPVAAMKLGATLARDVARAVVASLKNRTT